MSDLRIETPAERVRLLTLEREEKRNALSRDLIGALRAAVRAAEDEGIRALVITGRGSAFSAGADFSELAGDATDESFDAAMSELTSALEQSPLVSFAAISGPCMGAGFDLAMACDFRVAAPDAVFALPAVRMGILYTPARLARIVSMIDHAAASRLLLLADRLDQGEAAAAGIVTHSADSAGVLDTAIALAGRAAALPPQAQAAAKGFLAAVTRPDFNESDWQDRRMDLLASAERREALRKAKEPRT